MLLLVACTHQGGAPFSSRSSPTDVVLKDAGESVFRYETFGNERFFSDILGLDEGFARRGITPNDLLAAGVQLDADKLPSEFLLVDVGSGVYGNAAATMRLIGANAVIGLVARNGRVGVTCAWCHSRSDGRIAPGVGRRTDGVPNARLASGEVLAWGERSRAYLPFVNVSRTGSGVAVDLGAVDDAEVFEGAADAALRSWPRGQADILPDGVGNPTDIPSLFLVGPHGPYLWDGSFSGAEDANQYFATVVLDPTVLATPPGKAFLADGPFWPVGESLSRAYHRALEAIDPEGDWPRAAIFRASVFKLFHDAMDAKFRVNRDEVAALTAYLGGVLPPERDLPDERVIDAGRRVFRRSGCNDCHLEAWVAGGAVVPLATLVAGYGQGREAPTVENPGMGYDDRIALTPGEDSIARRGYKVPSLLGLSWSAPYLHDGSAPTLEALFSPERGAGAPHPYFIASARERKELAAFLMAWDGRVYP
ncbi:MAG: hypothetical protein AB1451_02225 [Nitrospirota bacterium]